MHEDLPLMMYTLLKVCIPFSDIKYISYSDLGGATANFEIKNCEEDKTKSTAILSHFCWISHKVETISIFKHEKEELYYILASPIYIQTAKPAVKFGMPYDLIFNVEMGKATLKITDYENLICYQIAEHTKQLLKNNKPTFGNISEKTELPPELFGPLTMEELIVQMGNNFTNVR